MDAQTYIAGVRERMASGGYDASTRAAESGSVLLGYRSDFRISWFATKLHLFIAVREAPVVTADLLRGFATEMLEEAKQSKGRFRGLQSGVAVIAAVAGDRVEPAGVTLAQDELVRQFAAFAWPVGVDLTNRECFAHQGSPLVGRVYNRWMKQQIAAILSPPAAV